VTVSSATNKVSYNGNGSTTVFAYGFKIFDEDDLTVIIRNASGGETTKTITTHYTVSGVGVASGGNVTMGTAPASGESLTIIREQPLTQGLDLVPNDPFPATLVEDTLDKITFMVHQHEETLNRTIKGSKTTTITDPSFTEDATARANKVFAFDASGNIDITQELGTLQGNWAAGRTYGVRDLVKDTSNNNFYICITAHTSSGSQPIKTNTDVAKWTLIIDTEAATTAQTAAETAKTAAETAQAASEAAKVLSQTAKTDSETAATNSSNSATASAASATAAAASATAAAASEASADAVAQATVYSVALG
jgi:hypothetical protein